MIRLLLSVVISATSWFEFLDWAWGKTEGQIDKMQDAAFDTPGMEPPVPPAVLMAALSVVAGHFAMGRLLRMRRWQSMLSLVLGVMAAAVLLFRPTRVS